MEYVVFYSMQGEQYSKPFTNLNVARVFCKSVGGILVFLEATK